LLEKLFLLNYFLTEHHKNFLELLIQTAFDSLRSQWIINADLRRHHALSSPLCKILMHFLLHPSVDLIAEQADHQIYLGPLIILRFCPEFICVDLIEKFLSVIFQFLAEPLCLLSFQRGEADTCRGLDQWLRYCHILNQVLIHLIIVLLLLDCLILLAVAIVILRIKSSCLRFKPCCTSSSLSKSSSSWSKPWRKGRGTSKSCLLKLWSEGSLKCGTCRDWVWLEWPVLLLLWQKWSCLHSCLLLLVKAVLKSCACSILAPKRLVCQGRLYSLKTSGWRWSPGCILLHPSWEWTSIQPKIILRLLTLILTLPIIVVLELILSPHRLLILLLWLLEIIVLGLLEIIVLGLLILIKVSLLLLLTTPYRSKLIIRLTIQVYLFGRWDTEAILVPLILLRLLLLLLLIAIGWLLLKVVLTPEWLLIEIQRRLP